MNLGAHKETLIVEPVDATEPMVEVDMPSRDIVTETAPETVPA